MNSYAQLSVVADPVVFTPGVSVADPCARYWLRQVTLRLRREVCWLWRVRQNQGATATGVEVLPPFVDGALDSLDLMRYEAQRQAFFQQDETARYLSDLLDTVDCPANGQRGAFGWVAATLGMTPVECFVLALAMLPAVDSAAGPVLACCQNDPSRREPTLALAQRLWDDSSDLLPLTDLDQRLARHGLLIIGGGSGASIWHAPLGVAAMVAASLLDPDRATPAALRTVVPASGQIATDLDIQVDAKLTVQPVSAPAGAPLAALCARIAQVHGLPLVQMPRPSTRDQLSAILCLCWLRGCALYLPVEALMGEGAHDHPTPDSHAAHGPWPELPVLVFAGMHDRRSLPQGFRAGAQWRPPLHLPPLSYAERLALWRAAVPAAAHDPALAEMARRFRYEQDTIEHIGRGLRARATPPTLAEMTQRARADLDLGSLAQPVRARFHLSQLMLPSAQTRQMQELVTALNNLTRAHYEWGCAEAWNEGGLAVLFTGAPGTGKTMAAEALAYELTLPLYRIDLSQVVNKYIGETEKNLRRLFDAAESADVILFFDEADALFGKRTEVKDAHDRYANLEVSYLLERMERFKGLAILATNRKRDLDEAFLRRLRFVVEFPAPGVAERRRIWESVIPPGVDASALDFGFLAERFTLAGGHIRAIVFHACLQGANEGAERRLVMADIVRAVKREYDKLERASSLEQFGPYAPLVAAERARA